MTFSHTEERTYQRLLGELSGEPTVWAECLFADPISDVAVLGPPIIRSSTPVRARLILGEGPAVRIRLPPAASLSGTVSRNTDLRDNVHSHHRSARYGGCPGHAPRASSS